MRLSSALIRAGGLLSISSLVLAAACLDTSSPSGDSNPATDSYAASLGINIPSMTKINDALYYQDLVVGTGTPAAARSVLTVTYVGYFTNGSQFDSNIGKTPFVFTLGTDSVIAGWDQGLVGTRAGGRRKLVIGSALAYGTTGYYPTIPPAATLVFDVQILAVK